MWTYSQATGELRHNGLTLGFGFSGYEDGINVPAMQDLPGIGPIPRGRWLMLDPPENSPTLGPYAFRLTPDPKTPTFGRSAFWCHGRSIKTPFDSSRGCLALQRDLRLKMWESGDRELLVTP